MAILSRVSRLQIGGCQGRRGLPLPGRSCGASRGVLKQKSPPPRVASVPWTLAALDGQPVMGYPTRFIALIICQPFPKQVASRFRWPRPIGRTNALHLGIQIAPSTAKEKLIAKLDERMSIPMM